MGSTVTAEINATTTMLDSSALDYRTYSTAIVSRSSIFINTNQMQGDRNSNDDDDNTVKIRTTLIIIGVFFGVFFVSWFIHGIRAYVGVITRKRNDAKSKIAQVKAAEYQQAKLSLIEKRSKKKSESHGYYSHNFEGKINQAFQVEGNTKSNLLEQASPKLRHIEEEAIEEGKELKHVTVQRNIINPNLNGEESDASISEENDESAKKKEALSKNRLNMHSFANRGFSRNSVTLETEDDYDDDRRKKVYFV